MGWGIAYLYRRYYAYPKPEVTMYKDIHRIEDALIPALLECTAHAHIRKDPECKPHYETMLDILQLTIGKCFDGLCREKRIPLYRRLDRIANKINHYFVNNDFNTRKSFLCLSEWVRALLDAGAIIIDQKSKYWVVLEDMGEIIMVNGYGEIPDFDKIDASAIKHVPALHKIAQDEGYFL